MCVFILLYMCTSVVAVEDEPMYVCIRIIYLPVYLSICLSIYLSICLSIYNMYIYIEMCVHIYVYIYVYIYYLLIVVCICTSGAAMEDEPTT